MIPEPELLSDDRIERRSNSTICQKHDRLCDSNAGCRSFLRKLREGSPEPMQGVDVTRGRKSQIGHAEITQNLQMRLCLIDQLLDVRGFMRCLCLGSPHG